MCYVAAAATILRHLKKKTYLATAIYVRKRAVL